MIPGYRTGSWLKRAHERSPAPGTSGHLRRPRHAPLRLERDQPAAACAAGRGAGRGRRGAARHRAGLAAARCRPHDPSAGRGSRRRAASTTCTRNWAPTGWPSASVPRSASRSACMSRPSAISAPSSRTISASSRPNSVRSLELQGGLMSADEIEAFRANPLHAEAVRLRRYDEEAKDPRAATPDFDHFLRHVAACRAPESHDLPHGRRGGLAASSARMSAARR